MAIKREIKFRLRFDNRIVGYEKFTYLHVRNEWRWLYAETINGLWTEEYIDHNAKDQFTGKKDNKGVEIYEGDIMDSFPIYKGQITKRVVRWDRRNASFEGCFGEEVIGNVFDNPELLESK